MTGTAGGLHAELAPHYTAYDSLTETLEPSLRQLREVLQQAAVCRAPELFVDFAAWLGRAGLSRNLPPAYVAAELEALHAGLDGRDGAEGMSAAVEQALAVLRGDAPQPYHDISPDREALGGLRRRFLGLVLAGLRTEALSLLAAAFDDGTPVERLYLEVLQPTLGEIGQLWEAGQSGVTHEHVCTGITRAAIAQLATRGSAVRPDGRVAVLAAVGRERHDLGLTMVADMLERHGWTAVLLGADTPVRDLPRAACAQRADLVALSCTLAAHLADLRAAISVLRTHRRLVCTPILVGGRAFAVAGDLWRAVGADAGASDAQAAVVAAERLVPIGRQPSLRTSG